MKEWMCAALIFLSGCVSVPYQYHGELYPGEAPTLEPDEPQISRGDPNVIVDGLGNLFGLPAKVILANGKVENHNISRETEDALRTYLAENGLTDVKVRINEYAPFGEWRRLTRNTKVAAGWRYTVGTIMWLLYTLLPQRIFGGDNYNPYTDTINLYSDLKVVALHEAGHAKDFGGREYKGTTALLRLFPIVPLFDEGSASSDALSYLHEKQNTKGEERGYKLLYPAFGTYVGGEIANFVPGMRYLTALAAIPGHIVGRIRAANVVDTEAGGEKGDRKQ